MTLRGSTSEFPLESVIGLLAGTSKTGELQVRGDAKVGALGFASGRLVAAVMDGEGGENALGAIFAISQADFEFTPWESAPEANLESGDLVSLLKRAAEARDRISTIRASIPDDRRLGKMQTLTLLSGLVKDGVIEALPAAENRPAERPAPYAAPEPEPAPPPSPPAEASSPPKAPVEPARPTEDWSSKTTTPPWQAPETATEQRAEPEPAPPPPPIREDLQNEIAKRMGGFAPVPEPATPGVEVPPAVDDRLSSLSGLFAPGPAANAPQQAPAPEAKETPAQQPKDWWRAPGGGRPPESWTTPPPASTEAPANAWAPSAKPKEQPANADPWGAPATVPQQESAPTKAVPSRADEWAPPPAEPGGADAAEKKKSGGFLGRFRREETPTPIARIEPASSAASRTGKLASLSNALLVEYNSGGYGKGKIETRLANLLMRVDEQADPIDRPLPVVDDLIDAAALEREGFDEHQALPYLATLVRQIYEDAERAFGKDKAKKGYKAAQQQVFGGDTNTLQSPELAGKLPEV